MYTNQTRILHNTNWHSCSIFSVTTHSLGTGITYVRLDSESKTSGGSVVRALSSRRRDLCDSATRSQRMSLSLSLSTYTCHTVMVYSHVYGIHIHIQNRTQVYKSKTQPTTKQTWDYHRWCTPNSTTYRSLTHPTEKHMRNSQKNR